MNAERGDCCATETPPLSSPDGGRLLRPPARPQGSGAREKHKKHGLGVAGIVALCLVCALLGGVSGGLIANNSQSAAVSGTDEPSNTGTLVQERAQRQPQRYRRLKQRRGHERQRNLL